MTEPTVIIHGWSDDSSSFNSLASFIRQNLGAPPIVIRIADWISMQNDVTYPDLALAMQRAWLASGLPSTPRSVNVVIHSTGALVTRDWMTKHFMPETVPIKRLLMLAPANFGSPLAHKGRSFIGRVLKGWGEPSFQTGTQILKGLELGSPYTFNLAERDLFNDRWYGRDRILGTVLVGNTGYSGVAAIANEDGSDGTVRISTANLNASKLEIVLDEKQRVTSIKQKPVNGSVAFGILDGENHSTIAFKGNGPRNKNTGDLILGALTVSDSDFSETGLQFPWQTRIDNADPSVGQSSDRLQNTVTYLRDNLDQDVEDYFVEFYRTGEDDEKFEKELYERFISSVHPYEDNPAYRSIYLDMDEFDKIKNDLGINNLFISLTAHPLYSPQQRRKQ